MLAAHLAATACAAYSLMYVSLCFYVSLSVLLLCSLVYLVSVH